MVDTKRLPGAVHFVRAVYVEGRPFQSCQDQQDSKLVKCKLAFPTCVFSFCPQIENLSHVHIGEVPNLA